MDRRGFLKLLVGSAAFLAAAPVLELTGKPAKAEPAPPLKQVEPPKEQWEGHNFGMMTDAHVLVGMTYEEAVRHQTKRLARRVESAVWRVA